MVSTNNALNRGPSNSRKREILGQNPQFAAMPPNTKYTLPFFNLSWYLILTHLQLIRSSRDLLEYIDNHVIVFLLIKSFFTLSRSIRCSCFIVAK